jgi:hypothetical protein
VALRGHLQRLTSVAQRCIDVLPHLNDNSASFVDTDESAVVEAAHRTLANANT